MTGPASSQRVTTAKSPTVSKPSMTETNKAAGSSAAFGTTCATTKWRAAGSSTTSVQTLYVMGKQRHHSAEAPRYNRFMKIPWFMPVGVAALVALAAVLPTSAETARQIPAPALDEKADGATSRTVVVAGGCFWGVQGVYQH